MLHLTAERLAALADEEPTMLEAAHLAACPECCRERSAQQRLVALAAEERARIAPPLTSWETLAPALARVRAEATSPSSSGGDSRSAAPDATVLRFAPPAQRGGGAMVAARRWGLRAAAAVALLGAGAMAGRVTAPESPQVVVEGTPVAPPTGAAGVDLVTNPVTRFSSLDEALRSLEAAERTYQQAMVYIAAHDTSASPVDAAELYRARLAALDRVMAATQEAMQETPLSAVDPVLNRTYMTTANAREATLRELRTKLPPGVRMNRY